MVRGRRWNEGLKNKGGGDPGFIGWREKVWIDVIRRVGKCGLGEERS